MMRLLWQRRFALAVLVHSALGLSTTPSSSSRGSGSSTSISSNQNPFVELVDPDTQCRITLLGCLHGSQSSAADVKALWNNDEKVDAVVLELCASRFADLQREESVTKAEKTTAKQHAYLERYIHMVMTTSQKKGLAIAVAAAVLGGASGVQTALSGFEPGLEFTTALQMASSHKTNVILADQAVDETLRKMGQLPSTSLQMLLREKKFPHDESTALQHAVFGDSKQQPQQQVNMGKVLTRNALVRNDLIKLTLPPLVLAQVVATTISFLWNVMDPASSPHQQVNYWNLWRDFSMTPMEIGTSVGMDILSSLVVLLMGYVGLALPATRIILCERDDALADGIRSACQTAPKGGRVVAVLGLLHVNGVAKRLLSSTSLPDEKH